MTVKTCLLVSLDPDDHIQFTEALEGVCANLVVLVVTQPLKALELMTSHRHIPDFVILDLDLEENRNGVLKRLAGDTALASVTVIAYGDAMEKARVSDGRVAAFLDNDISFSRLRKVLTQVMKPPVVDC